MGAGAQTLEEFQQMLGLDQDGTKRLPICFCLDTSGSMQANQSEKAIFTGEYKVVDGKRYRAVKNGISALSELKTGIKHFIRKIKDDEIAASSAEISIITFDDYAKCVLNFCRIDDIPMNIIDELDTRDNTYMGQGINLALDKLESCIDKYRDYGIDYYSPWLVIMSDGTPSDSAYEMNQVIQRITDMCDSYNLVVVPIGIGKLANMKSLSQLANGKEAARIYGVNFTDLFDNMNNYINKVSRSIDDSGLDIKITADSKQTDLSDNRDLIETKELDWDRISTMEFEDN